MIIFGTRGITTTPDRGQFHCPSCESAQDYLLKRVRRFFTLYFIPLIPLNKLGEYVECSHCKDTYNIDVLDYDPVADAQVIEAQYFAAIKRVMIHMLLADGVIDDSELDSVMDIYENITGVKLLRVDLKLEIKAIEASKEGFGQALATLQGCLNDEGKERVVTAALRVALADGEFQDEEKVLLDEIGKQLGMSKAHLQGVISSV